MNQPLAERLRPKNIEEFVGQSHLVGKDMFFVKQWIRVFAFNCIMGSSWSR